VQRRAEVFTLCSICETKSGSPVGWPSSPEVRGLGFDSGPGRIRYLQGFAV
jgi:hypothetical protein